MTATNIAKAAGLDRKLIYLYFDSIENLVETYIRAKDYWVEASDKAEALIKEDQKCHHRNIEKCLPEAMR